VIPEAVPTAGSAVELDPKVVVALEDWVYPEFQEALGSRQPRLESTGEKEQKLQEEPR
jgi:hypothetical protein